MDFEIKREVTWKCAFSIEEQAIVENLANTIGKIENLLAENEQSLLNFIDDFYNSNMSSFLRALVRHPDKAIADIINCLDWDI